MLKEKLSELVKLKSRAEIEVTNVKDTYKSMEKEFRKSVKAKDEITYARVEQGEEASSYLNQSPPPACPFQEEID